MGAAGGAVRGVPGSSRGLGRAHALEMPGLWVTAKRAEREFFGAAPAFAAAVRVGVEAV